MTRIVLTGSGSGGHFYPLIAIAESLSASATNSHHETPKLYLMAPNPYDRGSLFSYGIEYVHVPAGKVRRYFSIRNFFDFFKTLAGVFVALWKLYVIYPDVVMSKGSYTSVPVVIAATLLRIPIVIHESDVQLGMANKLASRIARIIAVSYEASLRFVPEDRSIRTGIPVRSELRSAYTGNAYETLGIEENGPLILVLGGSHGAERVNDLIITALDNLLPTYTILHQTGEQHAQIVSETAHALIKQKELLPKYHVRGFLTGEMMSAALTTAVLIISRAGSGTIYETALHGKPSILIPIPEEVSHDQRMNAYEYARTGAASVMEERNLTPHLLVAEITRIISSQPETLRMQEAARAFAPKDAAEKVATILNEIVATHS